jgi:hypothetical protein
MEERRGAGEKGAMYGGLWGGRERERTFKVLGHRRCSAIRNRRPGREGLREWPPGGLVLIRHPLSYSLPTHPLQSQIQTSCSMPASLHPSTIPCHTPSAFDLIKPLSAAGDLTPSTGMPRRSESSSPIDKKRSQTHPSLLLLPLIIIIGSVVFSSIPIYSTFDTPRTIHFAINILLW